MGTIYFWGVIIMNIKDNYSDKKMVARITMLQKLCDNRKLEYDVVKDKIIDRATRTTFGGKSEKIYKWICLKKKKLRKGDSYKGKIYLSILEFLEKLFVKRILREKKKSVLPYYMELYSKMDSLSNSINDCEKEIKTIVKKRKYSYTWTFRENSNCSYDTTPKVRRK